jgi:hypothetical protein
MSRCPNACGRVWPVARRETQYGQAERLLNAFGENHFCKRKLLARHGCFFAIVSYFAEVVTLGELADNSGAQVFLGGNDEVGGPGHDLYQGGTVIKAHIKQKQIVFLEMVDESFNEFVFRGGCSSIDKVKRCSTDKVKQAAKLNCNRPQSTRAPVCTETLPKGLGFRQGQIGLVSGNQAQPVPTTTLLTANFLQSRYQLSMQPGKCIQGKNANAPYKTRAQRQTILFQALR